MSIGLATPGGKVFGVDELERAASAYGRAQRALESAREALRAAILTALDGGARQGDIVKITGYTRETVRRIAREARHATDNG